MQNTKNKPHCAGVNDTHYMYALCVLNRVNRQLPPWPRPRGLWNVCLKCSSRNLKFLSKKKLLSTLGSTCTVPCKVITLFLLQKRRSTLYCVCCRLLTNQMLDLTQVPIPYCFVMLCIPKPVPHAGQGLESSLTKCTHDILPTLTSIPFFFALTKVSKLVIKKQENYTKARSNVGQPLY